MTTPATIRPRASNPVPSLVAALSALVVGGCGSSAVIHPASLPQVGAAAAADPEAWQRPVGPDGQPVTITGPVRRVIIEDAAGEDDDFESPFTAMALPDRLTVTDQEHTRTYAPSDVREVRIAYSDAYKRRRIPGGVLVGLGVAFLGGGTALVAAGAADSRGIGVEGLFTAGGIVMLVIGTGLAIPGVVLLVVEPEDPRERVSAAPAAVLGVGSAGLSWQF